MLKRIQDSWQRDPNPWLLAAIALLIYIPGSWWGFPSFSGPEQMHGWGNDDLVPLAPLADLHNTFFEAKPDWNTAYPWFQYFLLACAFGPYLVFLKLTGQMGQPSGVYPYGMQDPIAAFTALTIIGRCVSLAMAVMLVLGVYFTAKALFGRAEGLLAGLIAMLAYPMAYYARVGNVDIAAMAWTSLALAAFAAALMNGLTVRRGVALGVLVALALCTKDQMAAALYLPIPFLCVYAFLRGPEESLGRWKGRWVAPVITTMSFVVTYLLAGGILIAPERARRHFGILEKMSAAAVSLPRYPASPAGYLAQVQDIGLFLLDVLTWPLCLAALAGAVLLVRRNQRALPFLLAPVGYLLLLVPVRFTFIHYVMPLAIPLSVLAAYAIMAGWRAGKLFRLVAAVACVAGLGTLLLYTADLTYDMLRDSRYSASAWYKEHARPRDRILFFGAKHFQPHYEPSVELIKIEYSAEVLPAITQQRPEFITINPDNTTEKRWRVEWRKGRHSIYSEYVLPEVYAQLVRGELGYRLVAQFQSPRLLPWLDRPFLSYPGVNIPVQIFAREDRAVEFPAVTPWASAPHYPQSYRVHEITPERLQSLFP